MRAATTLLPEALPAAKPDARPALPLARARLADYLELTKPRIAVAVLFTVATGYLLAAARPDPVVLLHTLAGTALVAAGASALNQLLERHTDARMARTENRPLPAGRLRPREVLAFGVALGVGGLAYLALLLPAPWAAAVAGVTLVGYVFVYTPLKRVTPLNTLVGAVPGALPPVIGWAAAQEAGLPGWLPALALFSTLFLWQVPHFLAIAWIYRDDYGRAGLLMLPVVDRAGATTGLCMVLYCLALIPVSLLPALYGTAGPVYAAGAVALGLLFLASTLGFARAASARNARRVLRASLVYLPALMGLLLLSTLRGL